MQTGWLMNEVSTCARTDSIEFAGEGCHIRRHALRIEPGLLGVDQDVEVAGVQRGIDVTARFWIFAVVQVSSGSVRYLQGERLITVPGSRYAIYAPRFSIVEALLDRSCSQSQALASTDELANDLPQQPVLICEPPAPFPSSAAAVAAFLRIQEGMIRIGRRIAPHAAAVRVKEAIDESYTLSGPLSEIAERLRIAPSTMSRCFRKAYGMAPVSYRHHLRIMDAMMRLLDGETVTDVCQEVGFGDLSRFYRHFRDLTLATPARYRV